jgi:hypothetical protein
MPSGIGIDEGEPLEPTESQEPGTMATITSAQAGFADVGSTWVGGVAPGASDDIILAHSVTFRNNTTLAGLVINAGGVFIKGVDVVITMNGNIVQQNSNRLQIDWLEGGGMEFGNGGFTFGTPSQYPGSIPSFRVRGTEEKPCFLRTATGGTRAYFSGTSTYHGLMDCEWLNVSEFDNGSGVAHTSSLNSDGSVGNSSLIRFVNCTFDNCGRFSFSGYGPHARSTVQNSKFTNCLGDRAFHSEAVWPMSEGGIRLFDGVIAETRVNFNNPRDFSVRNCTLNGFQTSSPDGEDGLAQFKNNMIFLPDNGDPLICASLSEDNVVIYTDVDKTNAHFWEIGNYADITTYTISGLIIEFLGNDTDGDGHIVSVPSVPTTINFERVIVLPNGAGNTSATLASLLGNANVTANFRKSTIHTGSNGGIAVGETYAGHPGMVGECVDCIAWDTAGRGYLMFDSGVNDSVTDLIAASDFDYNCAHNIAGFSNNLEFTGTPNQNSITENPQFKDPTRDFRSFDVANGGDGNVTNALSRWFAGNYIPQQFIDYIHEGFTPQNAALQGAASDGGDIGAVAVVPASRGVGVMTMGIE